MSSLLQHLLDVPGWVVLLVVGAVVFAEDAVFVGFVVPGETAAILGGVAAKLGHVSLAAVLPLVVLAAIAGDSVGYEVGRHLGERVLKLGVLQKRRERLDQARKQLAERGGRAVFLGRWVAFFRAVMPALAGTARMPYRKFLAFNAAGGLVWGVTVVLVGYAAGASYQTVEKKLGAGSAIGVAAVVVVAIVVWRVSKHHHEHQHSHS